MCGIAGKLYFNPDREVKQDLLLDMAGALKHRGPDDQGIWTKNNVGLAQRRLSIIDLTAGGHQPMSDSEKKVWITFNGEIYNFLELRRELEKGGVQFRSQTDTEVIIHLYKKYGTGCLKYLRGMFAFAIWDEDKKQLFLARDRVGKKPFKYYINQDFIVFASELKALLKDPKVPKEPDFTAVHHFLTFQYAPAPLTGFLNIKKLPPAHYMVVKADGTSEIKRYWQLDYSEKWELPEKEWRQKIMDKLEESVKLRLIADVPLGAFLSGGVDSSAIVGLMAKVSQKPVRTFTIGFKEESHDEIPFARKTAKFFKTDHTEITVRPDAMEILPKLVEYYEEPYADSSAVPSWYVSEATRKYVTVALNGDGGDENFAGYTRYNAYKLLHQYNLLPYPLRRKILPVIIGLLAKTFYRGPRREKLLRFIGQLGEEPKRNYLELVSYFNRDQKNDIYTKSFKDQYGLESSFKILRPKFREAEHFEYLDQVFYADINTYLPDDLLVKMDIASMANGLETRSPLLDHEFLELCAKIPAGLKLKGQTNKYIFKKSLEGFLPAEILNRPKKGFGLPIERWFKNELRSRLESVLLSEKAESRGIFKRDKVEELIAKHAAGKANYAHHLWALLTLEHWFRAYFD